MFSSVVSLETIQRLLKVQTTFLCVPLYLLRLKSIGKCAIFCANQASSTFKSSIPNTITYNYKTLVLTLIDHCALLKVNADELRRAIVLK